MRFKDITVVIRDHPRVCGEKQPTIWLLQTPPGSPPRMRGKGISGISTCARRGITPAYAGKRPTSSPPLSRTRDHPRVCGEKNNAATKAGGDLGSPPRMRGKVPADVPDGDGPGITPAYAGKSGTGVGDYTVEQDHPRVCGEKSPPQERTQRRRGSPPRMRGKAERIHGAGV